MYMRDGGDILYERWRDILTFDGFSDFCKLTYEWNQKAIFSFMIKYCILTI